jgi:mRNA interferase RelE/StbE
MPYRPVYEPNARRLLRQLPPELKPAVKQAVESLRTDPYAGKELRPDLAGYRSLRSRRYRVIYRIEEEAHTVETLCFGVREHVYKAFRRVLGS